MFALKNDTSTNRVRELVSDNVSSASNNPYHLPLSDGFQLIKLSEMQTVQLLTFRYAFVVCGFATNFVVSVVILFARQLHVPRHMFWLGISLLSLCVMLVWLSEVLVDQYDAVCIAYELCSGIALISLWMFLSMAGVDRYVAVKHYDWYKRKMSNRKVVFALLLALTLSALIGDSPYWMGRQSVTDCLFDVTHAFAVTAFCAAFGIANVVFQLKLHAFVKNAGSEYFLRDGQLTRTGAYRRRRKLRSNSVAESEKNKNPAVGSNSVYIVDNGTGRNDIRNSDRLPSKIPPNAGFHALLKKQQSADVGRETLYRTITSHNASSYRVSSAYIKRKSAEERLDFHAAAMLSSNILLFSACTFPFSVNVFVLFICTEFQLDCSTNLMFQIDFPFKFILLAGPCIYMPVMYMLNCREFNRAFWHLFSKMNMKDKRSFHQNSLC